MAEPQTGSVDIALVAMPWEMLDVPSIQLGTLEALLRAEGFTAASLSLKLPFWEHCLAETAGLSGADRLEVPDYNRIAQGFFEVGLGEWIFCVPPLRPDDPEQDAAYLRYLERVGVPERDVAKAKRIRGLVPAFLERAREMVLALAPRVVGFTSTFSQNLASLVLARMLKERRPELPIIFGGANCDGPMGAALVRAFPWVDVAVRGEAEDVLPGLVRELVDGAPITPRRGLCFRPRAGQPGPDAGEVVVVPEESGGFVALEETPAPVYDEYYERLARTRFADEVRRRSTVLYEASRGCWWGEKATCTFCGLNATGMAFRSRSPERVGRDLLALSRRHRALSFQIVDNILDPRLYETLFRRLGEEGVDLRIFVETKSDLSRREVELLYAGGVRTLHAGIESLSTPILKRMRKGVAAWQNVRFMRLCAELGIRCYWNLLWGFPGEPREEYARMAELFPSLTHLGPPGWCHLRLDRFSPYAEEPERFGLEVLGPAPHYGLLYPVQDRALLEDLAYTFDFRHADGRGVLDYTRALHEQQIAWTRAFVAGTSSLVYRRGAGFLEVDDRRPGVGPVRYTFSELEGRIYLACEDGATPAQVVAGLGQGDGGGGAALPDVAQVRAYLLHLEQKRLVFREKDRFVALALPERRWRGPYGGGAAPPAEAQRGGAVRVSRTPATGARPLPIAR
jgi:ribosomal peptide maturation radical SAM protein 1